jgi:hypothetical protein
MRGFGWLLVLVGGAVVIAGVVGLIALMNAGASCTDECHGGLFLGAGGLLVIAAGLGAVFVGIALLGQRSAADRYEEDRDLRELRRKLARAR